MAPKFPNNAKGSPRKPTAGATNDGGGVPFAVKNPPKKPLPRDDSSSPKKGPGGRAPHPGKSSH